MLWDCNRSVLARLQEETVERGVLIRLRNCNQGVLTRLREEVAEKGDLSTARHCSKKARPGLVPTMTKKNRGGFNLFPTTGVASVHCFQRMYVSTVSVNIEKASSWRFVEPNYIRHVPPFVVKCTVRYKRRQRGSSSNLLIAEDLGTINYA